MEGDRYLDIRVRVTPELLDSLVIRDGDCNLVTIELGDPGEDGFYVPVFTVHKDDNPLERCGNCQRWWDRMAGKSCQDGGCDGMSMDGRCRRSMWKKRTP